MIVGGGIAGAACAWALSARGDDELVVLEREELLAAHSTSKNAGILRTLTESEATTRLALETAAFLASPPEGFSEVPLVDPVGLVLVPQGHSPERVAAWRAGKRPGAVAEPSEREVAQLLPHYGGQRQGALFVSDEGHIDTAALFEGLVRQARACGVRFETSAEVCELLHAEGRVHGVRLRGGRELRADVVVLAAGGWAGHLGAAAGSNLALEARRRHLLVTAPDARGIDPRWPVVWSEPDAFYAKPESGGLLVCACDQDAVHAVRVLGHTAEYLWHKETSLGNAEAVIVPGGFSYGDYLRTGAIARFSPIMPALQKFAADGGLVIGICNGFQILCEAGLLPGALIRNRSLQLRCEHVFLKTATHESPFTRQIPPDQLLRDMHVITRHERQIANEPLAL